VNKIALQDLATPDGICFGCGPQNKEGLQIKSYWSEDNTYVIAHHMPEPQYTGWPSLVYGGLISCLIDCHSNWTVMASHYREENREVGSLPCIDCVTGTLNIKYIKPTPMNNLLTLKAHVTGNIARKTRVICEVYANEILTAIGDSVFVRVDVGHLAKTAQGEVNFHK
tara:strand:- start:1445 stop:1948 length:504 start_codon:yes stop_codon:yes gene_type:complete